MAEHDTAFRAEHGGLADKWVALEERVAKLEALLAGETPDADFLTTGARVDQDSVIAHLEADNSALRAQVSKLTMDAMVKEHEGLGPELALLRKLEEGVRLAPATWWRAEARDRGVYSRMCRAIADILVALDKQREVKP